MAISKLAELARSAEIEGAVKALVDLGLVKCASQEEFDCLVENVCARVDDEEYDLQKVASLLDEILVKSENEGQEKTANLGAIIGSNRVANLSDREKAALIEHYGLPSDASLGIRNAGRGALGSGIGNILGAVAGGYIGNTVGRPLIGAMLGTPVGGMLGIKLMTDKYSQGNAREIMRRRRD